jgi:pSer/pThr/pTyr-binding forkhead associated (FHA) protein
METLPRAAVAVAHPLPELPMRAQLLPLDGGAVIELAKELTVVGRREDCDVRLDHKSVSKMHCVIVKSDGLLLLRDLGSTNGTRVNGQRVRRAALLPNDQVAIAGFKFRVTFGGENAAAAPDEHTQHLDAKEVANLLQPAPEADEESSLEIPVPPIHARPLPDVYPDDKKDQGK